MHAAKRGMAQAKPSHRTCSTDRAPAATAGFGQPNRRSTRKGRPLWREGIGQVTSIFDNANCTSRRRILTSLTQ